MKREITNLLDAVDNSGAGLISLEALKRVTAQLPKARSASRITVGTCRPPSPQQKLTLKRDAAAC
jgi:hypothetical protein